MTIKQYITATYSAETYELTEMLQDTKKRQAVLKNQLVFLERCVHNKLIPKSLRIRSPLQSRRGRIINQQHRQELLLCLKNDTKRKYFSTARKVKEIEIKLKNVLAAEDMNTIICVTDKSKETAFVKSRSHLQQKFNDLNAAKNSQAVMPVSTNHVKSAVLNLCESDIPPNQYELLNLGPKFVPCQKQIPYMDIVSTTECSSLKLEYSKKIEEAQTLRKDVLRALKMNKPTRNNMSLSQINAIKEIKNDDSVSIYPLDKGTGFVRIDTDNALKKLEEQLGSAKIIENDPTKTIASTIRSELCKLNKKKRFTKREYQNIYPSDPVPPRMYGSIKGHKPEKNYPMRVIVSTIGTATYGISDYLVKLTQPVLNQNKTRLRNSSDFVTEAETWNISPTEIQVSYDVVNLYPSVPLDEATTVILEMLASDVSLKNRTKLHISEIKLLIDLCLKRCYFLWNGKIYELENSGPIGLSFMVVLAESFLQYNEQKAINMLLYMDPPVVIKTFFRYVDDSHARFNTSDDADKFQTALNQQHPAIQYTIERENVDKELNFLDVHIKNNQTGQYEFKIHRKEAITNVQIRPTSNHDPKTIDGVFKGFVHRAFTICSNNHIEDELKFLTEVFIENGYEEQHLLRLVDQIRQKRNNSIPTQSKNETTIQTISLPWIPGLSPKLRKIYRKAGYKVVFKSPNNLERILTSRNKSRLPPNSQPGVYLHKSTCSREYIGHTKKQIRTRTEEHQNNIEKGRHEQPIAHHLHACGCAIDWEKSQTLKVSSNRFEREVREALEIQLHQCGPQRGGMNLDDGRHVTTKFWTPFFQSLRRKNFSKNKNDLSSNVNSNIALER